VALYVEDLLKFFFSSLLLSTSSFGPGQLDQSPNALCLNLKANRLSNFSGKLSDYQPANHKRTHSHSDKRNARIAPHTNLIAPCSHLVRLCSSSCSGIYTFRMWLERGHPILQRQMPPRWMGVWDKETQAFFWTGAWGDRWFSAAQTTWVLWMAKTVCLGIHERKLCPISVCRTFWQSVSR